MAPGWVKLWEGRSPGDTFGEDDNSRHRGHDEDEHLWKGKGEEGWLFTRRRERKVGQDPQQSKIKAGAKYT